MFVLEILFSLLNEPYSTRVLALILHFRHFLSTHLLHFLNHFKGLFVSLPSAIRYGPFFVNGEPYCPLQAFGQEWIMKSRRVCSIFKGDAETAETGLIDTPQHFR
jgi:hypothetical protein